MSTVARYGEDEAIELADGVFHLGVQDGANAFSNIPYLVVEGDEAAIIDPGSAKPEFFEVVLRKVRSVIDPKMIRTMIVQHQDPDLCAALPLLEPLVADEYEILAPLESQIMLQHYGTKKRTKPLDDGDTITLGGGRELVFAMTPYCHFVGSMVTYDRKTKTLFSSDIFGGFGADNVLYEDEGYAQRIAIFLGEYLGSEKAVRYAVRRLEQLAATEGIELVCPQHGCVIPGSRLPAYLDVMRELDVGGQVDALAKKHGLQLD